MITAWSPSRLNDYETCPAKAKYKHVDRLPEPPSAALDRGSRVHKDAETYIIGSKRAVPEDLKRVGTELRRLRKAFRAGSAWVEQALALDKDWKPVDWFAPTVWVRCKLDVLEVQEKGLLRKSVITDWKTGRNSDWNAGKYADQLELYSLVAISSGKAEASEARLIFTDTGEVVERTESQINMGHVLTLREKWNTRVRPMLTDDEFAPTPNSTCRWCSFSARKGGPCKF